MNKIEIKKVENVNEVENIINRFNSEFVPSLQSRVNNLNEYSKKLYNNAITIKAIESGKTIGFASLYCNDFENKTAYLTQIAVKNEARGRGVGQMLIDEVINICNENGMITLDLEVANDNIKAFNLYKKNGFYKTDVATDNSFYMKKNFRK